MCLQPSARKSRRSRRCRSAACTHARCRCKETNKNGLCHAASLKRKIMTKMLVNKTKTFNGCSRRCALSFLRAAVSLVVGMFRAIHEIKLRSFYGCPCVSIPHKSIQPAATHVLKIPSSPPSPYILCAFHYISFHYIYIYIYTNLDH